MSPCFITMQGHSILIFVTYGARFYLRVLSVQPPIQSLYLWLRRIYMQECNTSLSYFILAVPTRVFGKTLLHEFLIFFNHAECYLLFREIRWWKWSKSRLSKTNSNNDNNCLLSKLSYCCKSSGKEFSLYSYRKFIEHVCIFYKYYCKSYDMYFV